MRRTAPPRVTWTALAALVLTLLPAASARAASQITVRGTFISEHAEPDYDADDAADPACFAIDTPYDSDFDFTNAPGPFARNFTANAVLTASCPGGSISSVDNAHADATTLVDATGGALRFTVTGSVSASIVESSTGVLTPTSSVRASVATNATFTSSVASQLTCSLASTASGSGGGVFFSAADQLIVANAPAVVIDLAPGTHSVTFDATIDFNANGSASHTFDAGCTEGEPVVISEGPSGPVGSRDARFAFTTLSTAPPAGRYECRLDAGTLTPCTSPQLFAGLPDGAHHFEVLYHADGGAPGPAASRDWTVDGTAPRAVIDSAPSGDDNPPDATIAFHADSADVAGFECSVDSAPPTGCSSPLRLAALRAGAHVLELRAFDALGNAQPDSTVVRWTVGDGVSNGCDSATRRLASLRAGPALQCVVCPKGTQARVAFGQVVALALDPDRCFRRQTVKGRAVMVTEGPASVNGLGITPLGSELVLDPTFNGGEVTVGKARLSVGTLSFTVDDLSLDALNVGVAALRTKAIAVGNAALRKAGVAILPSIDFKLSKANDGQIEVRLKAVLPSVPFSSAPKGSPGEPGGGLSIEVPLVASNAQGVTGGVSVTVARAWFGPVEVRNLSLGYDHASKLLAGTVTLQLDKDQLGSVGKAEPGLALALEIPFGADAPTVYGPFSKFSALATNVQRQIRPGVYLQRFGGSAVATAQGVSLSATAGLSLGPRLVFKPFFEGEAASLDGTVTLSAPAVGGGAAFSLSLEGTGKLIEIPIANVKLTYRPVLDLTVTGDVEFSAFGYGLRGELVDLWVSPNGINAEARGSALLPGGEDDVNQFETVVSTLGYATCTGEAGSRYGFGRTWFDGDISVFGNSCDLGPYREARPAARALAADGEAQTFTVPAGRGVMGLLVHGVGGPPKLELRAPDGAVFATSLDATPTNVPRALIVQDPVASATRIVLRDPAPGVWTLTPLPGGGALATLATADELPEVVVTATTRVRAGRRVLAWSATNVDGQELVFTERSSRGAVELLRTRRARGSLVFTPQGTGAPARRIEVTVLRQGLPRSTSTVARFTVARPAAPRPVTGLRRTARELRWDRQAAAARYALAIRRPDGIVLTAVATADSYRLPARLRGLALRVTITALAADGRIGRAVTTRLPAPRPTP